MVSANVSRTDLMSMVQVSNTNVRTNQTEDFSSHMNQASSQKYTTDEVKSVASSEGTQEKKNIMKKMSESSQSVVKESDTSKNVLEQPEEMIAKVEDVIEEVAEIVADMFQITPQQVMDTMKAMNMDAKDLMETAGLTKLVAQLIGNENPLSLLMDGQSSDMLKNLIEQVSAKVDGFLSDTNMKREEFAQLVSQMQLVEQDVQQTEYLQQSVEEMQVLTERITQSTSLEQTTQQTAQNQLSDDEKSGLVMFDDEYSEKSQQTQNLQSNETNNVVTLAEENAKSSLENQHSDAMSQNQQTFEHDENRTMTATVDSDKLISKEKDVQNQQVDTILNQFVDAVKDKFVDESQEVTPAKIVQQIVEEIRVSMKSDVTSMELQLNPESLGKVNITVSAKEGLMTAQIAVQDAMVKEAVESQIQILRDNMNQQGIKVEAVEVVIAGHEFEQNLEKENQQGEAAEQNKKAVQRKFKFVGFDEMGMDDVTEDIVKLQTVSTVSYQA